MFSTDLIKAQLLVAMYRLTNGYGAASKSGILDRMKLSREDVLKMARLSRLKLSEEEIEQYQKELSEIVTYVDKLSEVDVVGLKPTYQVSGLVSTDDGATREDVIEDQVSQKELFKNVPDVLGEQIKVNRMIG